MTTYFLSYARIDEAVALRFARDLMSAGFSVWVDQFDIRPSQHWDRAVETAVRSCGAMIVILSPASAASPNVADEVTVAIEEGKRVVPILVQPCTLPLRMSRMQFIDATGGYERALERCIHTLSQDEPPAAAERAANGPSPLPAELLARAERRLLGSMGPIASRLVRSAARLADSETDLYRRLAESIPDPVEREAFLGWISQPSGAAHVVNPRREDPEARLEAIQDIEFIVQALARQLGPIARHLVERERKGGEGRDQLRHRLAERIPDARDRATFLKDTKGG